jgi:uncharacterized coiled-coil protein SlyX
MAVDYRISSGLVAMNDSPEQPQPAQDAMALRLERLEEAQTFASHDVDQLSAQVLALDQKVRELTERLRRLESGVSAIGERLNDPPSGEIGSDPPTGSDP